MVRFFLILLHLALLAPPSSAAAPQTFSIFNGKDLTGWTPKFTGHSVGTNYANTFRVDEGILKVRYDQYPKNESGLPLFEKQFGHLFFTGSLPGSEVDPLELSHYRLLVEYRFVGEQTADGPAWAERNSGVMLHGQRPETMQHDQEFPTSIEVQFLGGLGADRGDRPTANLCTPGTLVELQGKLFTKHCTKSSSPSLHGDQWVTVEVEVRGEESVRHYVNGDLVLEYGKTQLEEADSEGSTRLTCGSLSLQSESHPIDFRRVEIELIGPSVATSSN